MRDDAILTLDLGTTRLKVAAFDLRGKLLGQQARRNIERRDGDFAWQSAESWWADTCDATRALVDSASLSAEQIKGISLSGRAGAGVFVDATGHVLSDPWSDDRHRDILDELIADAPRTSAQYGPTLMAKLLWLKRYRPDEAARVRYALYGKDYLLFRLTGEAVTDPASGPDGSWDEEFCARWRVDVSLLPHVALPWTVAGTLEAQAATRLGLLEGTPVAVGAHDGICANAGAAAITPGRLALTLGTHAVMRGIADTWPEGARRFYGYPPDKHVIGGNALYAGRALDWFVDQYASPGEHDQNATFAALDRSAGAVPVGSRGVRFLPFLQGRLAPARRPRVRGAFTGLDLETNRDVQYRAMLEGTGFALREVFDQLVDWIGVPSAIGVTGSGARSETWVQILANILDAPLTLTDGASEGRGAAIYCATALGVYPSVRDATANMVVPSRTVEPTPSIASEYAIVMESWQSVAEALGDLDESR